MSAKKHKNKAIVAAGGTEQVVKSRVELSGVANKELIGFKEEAMIWLLSVLGALVVYGIVALIIQQVYHPDTAAALDAAKKLLISPESARPEPTEAMMFRAAVVVLPLCLLGFYSLLSGRQQVRDMAHKPMFMILFGLCIVFLVGMIYYDFAAQNPFVKDGGDVPQNSRDFIGFSNFDFYFDGFFLGSYAMLYSFILVPVIACLFFFGIRKYKWDEGKTFKTGTNVVGYGVFGLLLLACVSMSIFSFPYTFENKYNFNAVYYSMTQVFSGSPLLVGGFTNTYGMYPEFLNPLFQVIGLSVYKFTVVMAVLLGLSFVMNFFSMKKFVSNSIILFLGMIAVVYFPFVEFKLGQAFDCNFAVYPIRYIIPSALLFMSAIYLTRRSKVLYWSATALMAFFVLWNPEIGMVCYLAWLALNVYSDLWNAEGRLNIKAVLVHIGIFAVVVIAAFLLYKLLIQMVYGSSPDLGALFGTILVFGKVGFNLLPMKLVHPWNIMGIILLLGFMYSISKWYGKQVTPKASMIFLVSVLGLGYFFYFQGRSHNWQLAQSSGMTFFLLALLGDELWGKLKANSVPVLNAVFVLFLLVISFSFFEAIYNTDKIIQMVHQDDEKSKEEGDMKRFDSNEDFVLKNSRPHERVFMVVPMQYQGLYFDGNKRVSAYNPGEMDLFLNSDITRMEDSFIRSADNVFIEPSLCTYPFLARPLAAVAATYEYKAVNQTMALLSKRQIKVPKATFFSNTAQIVHKKYTDDTTGIKQRISDAQGTAAVDPGAEFSVEVLFNAKLQVYQFGALVGNMTDTSGFLIHNVLNSSDYFFGINGKGVTVSMPINEWVYCVMNVYPDRVEIFRDGELAGSFGLPHPLRPSHEKLFIGNIGFMHYFVGAIAEVAVNNKAIDKAQIANTWGIIKQQL